MDFWAHVYELVVKHLCVKYKILGSIPSTTKNCFLRQPVPKTPQVSMPCCELLLYFEIRMQKRVFLFDNSGQLALAQFLLTGEAPSEWHLRK